MKKALSAISVCLVFCICQLKLTAGGKTFPALWQNAPTFYVPAIKAAPDHVRLLDQRRNDLDRLLDFYNYNRKESPWDFKELLSPLIKKDAIFKFDSIQPSEGNSGFVIIIPLAGGEISLIPLWDHGLRPMRNIELDPHNIAIFNALVAREQLALKTDSERLNLAILYLHFFEEQPKILENINLAVILGKPLPEKAKNLLPNVKLSLNEGFDVRLFEQFANDDFGEISFSFDRSGNLRNLTKETRTKLELLDSD